METRQHHAGSSHVHEEQKWNYKPLIVIVLLSLLLAYVQATVASFSGQVMMRFFMGYFFVFLSLFKFFDLDGFVEGFATYDLITQKVRQYGYAYPFIELALGLAFISAFMPIVTNGVTLAVMLVSGVGVLKSVGSGAKIKCACLGTALNVPLSTVSILENFGMGVMAAVNLWVLV